jgi:hypothetical protein
LTAIIRSNEVLGPVRGFLAAGIDLVGRDPGIVEGAVEPAIGDDRVVEHRLDVLLAGDVAGQGDRLAARGIDPRHGLGRGVGGVIGDRDPRALARQGERGGAADPAAAAGDQRRFAVEQPGHDVLPSIRASSIYCGRAETARGAVRGDGVPAGRRSIGRCCSASRSGAPARPIRQPAASWCRRPRRAAADRRRARPPDREAGSQARGLAPSMCNG